MSSATVTATTTTESRQTNNLRGQRGGTSNRARGRGGHNHNNTNKSGGKPKFQGGLTPQPSSQPVQTKPTAATDGSNVQEAQADVDDSTVCWICAEPIKYYALPQCNHRTCHICALRLRALYKKLDCTFCKEPQPVVIFTESPDALFSSFAPQSIEYKDTKLDIFFESQEMMEETLLLLRFNCPDSACDYIGSSWSNLKLHVRATHGKLMCDLCIRSKKVFAHEHTLYPPNHLSVHLPSSNHRPPRNLPKEKDVEGGAHPLCEFCRECFFAGDELYAHMRERHEECFLCKRNEVRDQYFKDYESMERHFDTAHYPCNQPSCQAQKFVVFNSAMDLKAHTVEEHGGEMSARDKRDFLRVHSDFDFERNGRRAPPDRERDREPPPPAASANVASRRRQAFAGNLTVDGPTPAQAQANGSSSSVQPSRRPSPEPPRTDVDPAVLERHAQFMSRVQSLAPNPGTAVPSIKAAIRGYRANEESARGLISTTWTVLGERLEPTASIINSLVDILDEEDKKQQLLAAWKGFEIEQRRQFPDLAPTGTGTGFAGIATGRVLNVKSKPSAQSSRQVWDRVAQAASSSSTRTPPPRPAHQFPSLPQTTASPAPRQSGQRMTPWSASARGVASGTPPPTSSSSSSTKTSQSQAPPPPKLNKSLFPELPTSSNTRAKPTVSGNTSLKNILGVAPAPAQPAWGSGTDTPANETPSALTEDTTLNTAGGGGGGNKGKKGKGKQKQTLFTLGTFPS